MRQAVKIVFTSPVSPGLNQFFKPHVLIGVLKIVSTRYLTLLSMKTAIAIEKNMAQKILRFCAISP